MASRICADCEKLPKIDLKDKKIISLLANNSRATFSEIAKKVMLSRDAIRYRIERMEKLKVIQKFFPVINYEKFNKKIFYVFIQNDSMNENMFSKFIDFLNKKENVLQLIEYSDLWDMEIKIVANSVDEFDALLTEILNNFHEGIDEIQILENINELFSYSSPGEISDLIKHTEIKKNKKQEVKLDDTDIKLLKELANNSRNTSIYYANKLKVSQDTINYRIDKLLKNDVISWFTAAFNFSLLGYNYYTVFLSMNTMFKEDINKVKQVCIDNKNIIYGAKTIGNWNFIIKLVAKNQSEFHHVLKYLRKELRTIIRNIDVLLAYKEHKFDIFTSL